MKHIFDKWASVYDTAYWGKNTSQELQLYMDVINNEDAILEVACGTGRVYLQILADGYDISGIDISQPMLDILESKAIDRGLEPNVQQADMRSFSLDEEFDVILVPFNSFLHNLQPEDQIDTLERIRNHLSDEGKAVINFTYPRPELLLRENEYESEIQRGGSTYRLVERYSPEDKVENILKIERHLYEGGKLIDDVEYLYALVHKREFEHLLHIAGFTDWDVFGGFDYQGMADPDEMVWVVTK